MSKKINTNKFDTLEDTCGCGKPVKYTTSNGKGACNKYGRCPTYNELDEMLRISNFKLYQLQQIMTEKMKRVC